MHATCAGGCCLLATSSPLLSSILSLVCKPFFTIANFNTNSRHEGKTSCWRAKNEWDWTNGENYIMKLRQWMNEPKGDIISRSAQSLFLKRHATWQMSTTNKEKSSKLLSLLLFFIFHLSSSTFKLPSLNLSSRFDWSTNHRFSCAVVVSRPAFCNKQVKREARSRKRGETRATAPKLTGCCKSKNRPALKHWVELSWDEGEERRGNSWLIKEHQSDDSTYSKLQWIS